MQTTPYLYLNIQSRKAEPDHVEEWAQTNDLKLNRAKSMEIVITGKRKHQDCITHHTGYQACHSDHYAWRYHNKPSLCQ